MKHIVIPETPEQYQADLMARAFPDQQITENDFYRRMIGWVVDNRTPLLYEQTHPDEYANLSINFNWLLVRDYGRTALGPPGTILSLYSLHEFAHMTHWLPTRLDQVTAGEYADQFTRSEYRASNESEILAHYRIPTLRGMTFQGMRLAVDLMKERGISQPAAHLLNQLRAFLIEYDMFDHLAGGDPDTQAQLARLKQFDGNRAWARQHYQDIRPFFTDTSLPQSHGLTDAEYEPVITAYEPRLSQERYEANIIRNVRFAYAMCGQTVPLLTSFGHAVRAARSLEGRHALV